MKNLDNIEVANVFQCLSAVLNQYKKAWKLKNEHEFQ